ncbi:MAG TPA: hypothetical protein VGC15_06555 [Acetobacteraceae bacterium]
MQHLGAMMDQATAPAAHSSEISQAAQGCRCSGGDGWVPLPGRRPAVLRRHSPQRPPSSPSKLAADASELRNEIADAWRQSAGITVCFPLVRVSDAESGAVRITPATFGSD